MEERMEVAYRRNKERFPTQVWHCCKQFCFSKIAADPKHYKLFEELGLIHEQAERFHLDNEVAPSLHERRRRGIGTSTISFTAPSRAERESASGQHPGTERENSLRQFGNFVVEVLPSLYGQADSPNSNGFPQKKLCTQAICCLLGVSRNFLYGRKTTSSSGNPSADELSCLVDTAGVRLRQLRRLGIRGNYPSVQILQGYDCGCDSPCFAGVPQWTLIHEYREFVSLAKELRPWHLENCFLLNRMFSPLTNSTILVCNRAIYALYTVSEALVADVRRVLDAICSDPSLQRRTILTDGAARYKYDCSHPMNRYPEEVRDSTGRSNL